MAGLSPPRVALGLWDGHDAGVALAIDGQLRIALNEERVVRKKRASGFPYAALQVALDALGLGPDAIDRVLTPGRFGRLAHRALDPVYRRGDPNRDPLSPASRLIRDLEVGVARLPGLRHLEAAGSHRVLRHRLAQLGIRAPITLVGHHEAHAYTARLVAPTPDAMIVTLDGYGDGLAGTVDLFSPHAERLLSPRSSPALVYGAVTRLLGFKEGDEGKVMGLAARGDPAVLRDWFRPILGFERCDPALGGAQRRAALKGYRREDVAAAVQEGIESLVLGWIAARRRGRAALAVSGGLFANVSLNGRLADRFDRLGVFPHMGDGGLCVGALAAALPELTFPRLPFLGPQYSETRLRDAIRQSGRLPRRSPDPSGELLRHIAAGHIVARFVGRSEFGPRALGHRSILMRADRPALVARLNRQLGRDAFMPFAPVRRSGAGSQTMTVVVAADAELLEACPAVVHVDGTVRTQRVCRQADPQLWDLLERAEALGMPALVNTSFNTHGEPIVETPEDALQTFEAASLGALQLGDFIVEAPDV